MTEKENMEQPFVHQRELLEGLPTETLCNEYHRVSEQIEQLYIKEAMLQSVLSERVEQEDAERTN